MTDAMGVSRVTKSIVAVLKRHGWEIESVSKSNRSISRYVRASKSTRNITVRVSDHKCRGARCDFDFHPNWYNERHFGCLISRKKTRFRTPKR